MSQAEQDIEIGRLVRQRNERHRELLAMTAKLRRIGEALARVSLPLQDLDKDIYGSRAAEAKNCLEVALSDVDVSALQALLAEFLVLKDQFVRDSELLRRYGV